MITILLLIALLGAVFFCAVVDPCSLDSRVSGSSCYNCLTQTEKLAARVMFKARALKAEDGLDLTDVNTMRKAAACHCVPDSTLESFEVYDARRVAVAAGATSLPSTAAELRAAIKCYCSISQHELKAAESILDCYLI